ncbi:neurofascin-like [Dreissena polymorpha]|nr:neurofascin-like [Dreissena polymorpha]XP_052251606.1 neurofascin-like [Dreissena polymorpha]XP_052251608.1 neurofascin-like [Dreissena polymorpha]XP_052251609.1 neurofascin-like [Dreissena polymorpha]XP_052251610.1 neurofascin-like [Dreissena polymorpha]XP_052251611.1 neurofascin-like [Dreissena polymorpha]XP_052251612.1 neurofascin-like [Dreissena polymorpha]XP_052251613.1 neurofascin-like [Dreissena polymorpha]XP_052251614.1 neurofascin-like [Dreissena polymorpha]XP_052251615.1 neuro
MYLSAIICCVVITTCIEARGTPPKISIPQGNNWPKPLEYIRKGNNRTFSCVATGSAPLKYEWRFNGEKLNAREKEARFDPNTGSLFIGEYFNEQLTGDYQCVVSNEYGTSMTPYLRIAATVANAFPGGDGLFPDNVEAYRSNYLKMDCINVPKSVPAWTFNWQRGKMVANTLSDTNPVSVGERMIIDPNGSLHFLWVEMSDNGYIYACETKNEIILMDVRNTHTMKLNVQSGTERDRTPELKYSSDVTVMAGDTAELTCIFTYYSSRGEKLDITWTFNNKEVGHGSMLRLPNIKVPDQNQNSEGEYVCEAKLGLLQPVRGKVNLKITAPPDFIRNKAPALTSVPVGQDAVFHCGATSHKSYMKPPVWMVNSKPLIGCFPNHFDCGASGDGFSYCIPDKQVCDSNPDCPNQRDEQNCGVTITCGEGTKPCKGHCISVASECPMVMPTCTFPGFGCDNNKSCLQGNQVCNGKNNCGDGSDELGCAGGAVIERGQFRLNSERTELTLPKVKMENITCFQCLVQNEYGVLFGDGCLTPIDKIKLTIPPNDTYYTQPDSVINVGVDATTDVDWMNQMAFKWYWYRPKVVESGPNEGQEIIVREQLPPTDMYRDYFSVSLSGKNLTITIPKVDREASDKTQYDLYNVLTTDRLFQVVVAHKYDSVERNFTVTGEKVEPPIVKPVVTTASFNLWFIALILAILILFIVIALIVCYMYRNRGGTYLLDKKEKQAGNNPVEELKNDGFNDVGRIGDDDYNDAPDTEKLSLSESVKPYDSDEDITEEYGGDFDVSKFNEDGSFIGLYGDRKSKYGNESKEATV